MPPPTAQDCAEQSTGADSPQRRLFGNPWPCACGLPLTAGVRLLQIQQQSLRAGPLRGGLCRRILQGTKPVDLPVEEPMQCELACNLKTATEMGVTMPPHVVAQVDRVSKRQ
jgi:hypothetical protein